MNSESGNGVRRGLLRVLALCTLFATAALYTNAAGAQQTESGEYKELIAQALLEFKHKNWPEARVLFRRAHELQPSARTLRGMGVVSYEMRDYVQAVRDLAAALEDPRQPLTEAQRKECQGLLGRARTFVGEFTLTVTPQDASLTLDGATLVREPNGALLLSFGEHEVSATAPGYEAASTRVRVQGGERGEIELHLTPLASVTAEPAEPMPTTVERPTPAAAALPEAKPVEPAPSGLRGGGLRYTWVMLGAAALFGGGAIASYYLGDRELDDLDARCARRAQTGSPCEPGKVDTSKVKRYERMTNAAIGVSAGALLGAVLFAYFEWPRERELSVAVGPSSLTLQKEF